MCCGSDTTTTTSSTQIPQELKDYYIWQMGQSQDLYNKATNTYNAQTQFPTYQGPRVAGLTGDQQTAIAMARNAGFMGGDQFTAADRALEAARANYGQTFAPDPVQTQAWNTATAQQYMNPYTQTALQASLDESNRQNDIARLADQGRAAKAGAFGGSRHGIVDAERDRNLMQTQNQMIANANNQAYGQAQQQFNADANRTASNSQFNTTMGLQAFNANRDQFNTDSNRDLQAASTWGSLGAARNAAYLNGANALMNAGNAQQQNVQQNYNTAYGDFKEQQQYPWTQLSNLMGTLKQQPVNMGQTTTSQQPTASTGQQMAGLGIAALGAAGAAGGFGKLFSW